jgi:integrase
MGLNMPSPTKHPKTGVFRVRVAIPHKLRSTTARLYERRVEFVTSLETRDPIEAKRLAPDALADIAAKLARARAAEAGTPTVLSERTARVMAGQWLRTMAAGYETDPGTARNWRQTRSDLLDQRTSSDGEGSESHLDATKADRRDALQLLTEHGIEADEASIRRLTDALWDAKIDLAETMERRAAGDWSAKVHHDRFPEPTEDLPHAPAPVALFDVLLAGWASDHGHDVTALPIARAVYDRKRTMERLAVFLGHRDGSKVAKADAVRWKQEMQSRSLAVATVRNDLSEMSAIWTWGVRNDKLTANPFEGVSPPKEKGRKRHRRAFTHEEAVAILTAARGNKGYMRWLPWVCCLTGARLSEICQSSKEDVMQDGGVWVLRIHDEGDHDADGLRSLKNEESRRSVPIHPALQTEGFLAYVAGLPVRSALFPDAKPDKVFGNRATSAGRKVSRWLKDTLTITDPRISPNHSWRHYFIGACRGVSMNSEVRSALTGHSAKADESAQYGDGMKSFVRVLADALATVPCPVGPRSVET